MLVYQRLWWMNMNQILRKKTRRTIGDVRQQRKIVASPWNDLRRDFFISPPDQWGMASSHLKNISQLHLMIIASRDGNWYTNYTNYSMWNHQPNVDCLQYMFISIRCHATSGCGYAYGMLIKSTKNERERERESQKTCIRLNWIWIYYIYIYIYSVYI